MSLEDLKNETYLDEGTDAISSGGLQEELQQKEQCVRNLHFENYVDLIKKKSNISGSGTIPELRRLRQDNHGVTDSLSYVVSSHFKES